MARQIGSGWYADPAGRHARRWWDGAAWRGWVDDGSGKREDPLGSSPAWSPPEGRRVRSIPSLRPAPIARAGDADALPAVPAPTPPVVPVPPPVAPLHPSGWYEDPCGTATLRWWDGRFWTRATADRDGEAWALGSDDAAIAAYAERARSARRARRPVTAWFAAVLVLAIGGFVPTFWAQQDFGQPMHGLACAPEPWHVDPAGVAVWWIWVVVLEAVVVGGLLLLRGKRHELRSDRRVGSMTTWAVVLAVTVPPLGWFAGYMMAGMNCGL